jgi:hypothetical protein
MVDIVVQLVSDELQRWALDASHMALGRRQLQSRDGRLRGVGEGGGVDPAWGEGEYEEREDEDEGEGKSLSFHCGSVSRC